MENNVDVMIQSSDEPIIDHFSVTDVLADDVADVLADVLADDVTDDVADVVTDDVTDVLEMADDVATDVAEQSLFATQILPEIPPEYIFVIPYRDRIPEKYYFIEHMQTILVSKKSFRFLFIHQTDSRTFNRGAMKNIGFITTKMHYPTTYKNVTLIFNDVDTMPKENGLINYETQQGVVKHFYGFRFSLGGIVSIKGNDFERCNGYPNFYGYAYEDNLLYKRCQNNGIDIDRSNFFEIGDQRITHSNRNGPFRTIRRDEFDRFVANTTEGIYQIFRLKYTIEQFNDFSGFINVLHFDTPYLDNVAENVLYDTRITSQPFKPTTKQVRTAIQPFSRMKFM